MVTHTITTPTDGRAPFRIFLAGSIDNGDAEPWHAEIAQSITDVINERNTIVPPLEFYNPRRDNWDKDCSDVTLHNQIRWELDTMMKCDLVLIYFTPNSKSPVTMLELGLLLGMGKTVQIYVPNEFWRKDNVIITFNMMNTNPQSSIHSLKHDFITYVVTNIKNMSKIDKLKVIPNVFK